MEILHFIEHALGLCGEKHISLLISISEYPNINLIIKYLKNLTK